MKKHSKKTTVEEKKKHLSLFPCCSRRRKAREQLELERHRQIMSALENLNESITKLTASVDRVIVAFGTAVPEASVQAAADAVNAQVVKLDAIAPPPPSNP